MSLKIGSAHACHVPLRVEGKESLSWRADSIDGDLCLVVYIALPQMWRT